MLCRWRRYDPADMLKLYPYGWYLNRVRSSRRLEVEATCNLNLFGRELLAVGGTRPKAVNNPGRNFSCAKLRAERWFDA